LNTAKKIIALAHKTLLASVGTYGCGREIVANKFDQLFVDGSVLANELLRKGASLEAQLQAKIEAKKMLQDKILALKARLGFGSESRDQQLDILSQRVDSLIEVVAKLAQQNAAERKTASAAGSTKQAASATIKKPVKPAVAKLAATKSVVAKPTANKPSAVKPTAVKPTEAKPTEAKPTEAKPSAAKTKVVKPTVAKTKVVKPAVAKPENVVPANKLSADDKGQ
jgi:hypothetical protein